MGLFGDKKFKHKYKLHEEWEGTEIHKCKICSQTYMYREDAQFSHRELISQTGSCIDPKRQKKKAKGK